jgi:hypothetical protein
MTSYCAGNEEDDGKPPEQRKGSLWDEFRRFKEAGIRTDASCYSTAFRAKAPTPELERELQSLTEDLPAGVPCEPDDNPHHLLCEELEVG